MEKDRRDNTFEQAEAILELFEEVFAKRTPRLHPELADLRIGLERYRAGGGEEAEVMAIRARLSELLREMGARDRMTPEARGQQALAEISDQADRMSVEVYAKTRAGAGDPGSAELLAELADLRELVDRQRTAPSWAGVVRARMAGR